MGFRLPFFFPDPKIPMAAKCLYAMHTRPSAQGTGQFLHHSRVLSAHHHSTPLSCSH